MENTLVFRLKARSAAQVPRLAQSITGRLHIDTLDSLLGRLREHYGRWIIFPLEPYGVFKIVFFQLTRGDIGEIRTWLSANDHVQSIKTKAEYERDKVI